MSTSESRIPYLNLLSLKTKLLTEYSRSVGVLVIEAESTSLTNPTWALCDDGHEMKMFLILDS